jgi:predicted O-methyltransferase YrrM
MLVRGILWRYPAVLKISRRLSRRWSQRDSTYFPTPDLEDLTVAAKRLPGPQYYQVLAWIHRILRPANYLEIGLSNGVSLRRAIKGTRCIGIDPSPQIEHDYPGATIYEVTSDEFFEGRDLEELLNGPVELAFIDDLHRFEEVLRDFVNVERHSSPETVIVLHDCLPLNAATASRERATYFYSGDVWKSVLALRRERPGLEMVTVRTAPTGLCLVRGVDNSNTGFEGKLAKIVESYIDYDFDYYLAHRNEMPEEIANNRRTVRSWLARSAGSRR